MIHILVADDEAAIRTIIQQTLERDGYSVHVAADGHEALRLMETTTIQLAILDVMMPLDGYTVCEQIHQDYDIPVLLVTAKAELDDKLRGFKAGSDDYMTKPFAPEELLFRVKALLRRYQIAVSDELIIGETKINRKSYEVTRGTKMYFLPLKEFELLYFLANAPTRTFRREEIIEAVWGLEFTGDDRTVDVHVKRLRERFHDNDDFTIATIRGVGYKLELP